MKKLVLIFAVAFGASMVSCGGNKADATVDEAPVEEVAVEEVAAVDSAAVDTAAADTVVVAEVAEAVAE